MIATPWRVRTELKLVLAVAVLCCVPAHAQSARRGEESFAVAIGLLQRGLHEEASRQLETFLREYPEHVRTTEAMYRLGTCREALKDADAALAAFQNSLQRPGEFSLRAECRFRLATLLREKKQYEGALAQLEALRQEVEPGHYLSIPAQYAAAECLRDLGRDEDALAAFLAVPAGDADGRVGFAVPALYQAGFALMRLQRFGDAANTFAGVAERFSEHEAAIECRYLEGDAAFRAGDVDRAEVAYAAACRAGGEFADDAQMGLAWCALEQKRDEQALARFRELVSRYAGSPHVARARLEAGRILYRTGEHDLALAELAPLDSDGVVPDQRLSGLELQGLTLLDSKRAERAVACFARALALTDQAPVQARLSYNMGEALAELGQWQEAFDAYSRAETHAEGALRGDVLYGQSLALHKLGRLDDSLARARALLDSMPEHRLAGHARFAIAENLFAAEKWRDADAAYAELPVAHELAAKAAHKRAWCAFLGNDPGTAAERFEALSEGGPFAEEALSMVALASLNAERDDAALAAADHYRARYPAGEYLDRTERVAARVLRKRGDLRGAAQRISTAAQAAHGAVQGAEDELEAAELHFQQGDFAAAAERYTSLAARDDSVGLKAAEGLAWCAFETGEDELCLRRCDEALQRRDATERRPSLLELQLAALHRKERWADAERTATEFLRDFARHPRAGEIAFGLGVAQSRAGKHAAARATFAALVQSGAAPSPGRVYYEWAWAARKDGADAEALQCFTKVAECDEDVDRKGEANLHLGLAALAANDVASARDHFAKVEGKHRAQALYRIAFTYLDANEPARAAPLFETVVGLGETEPLYWEALFLAGECAFRQGEHAVAAQRYGRLLQGAADHNRAQAARLHAGQCLVMGSQSTEAVNVLEDFLRRGSELPAEQAEANLWLGRARAARSEWDLAEAALQRATEQSEGEIGAQAQFWIGEVRRGKGDVLGAVDAYVKLSILYGHEVWVRRGLLAAGIGYTDLGQPAKAAVFFEELVQKHPDSDEAKQAKARLASRQPR